MMTLSTANIIKAVAIGPDQDAIQNSYSSGTSTVHLPEYQVEYNTADYQTLYE